MVNFRLTLRNMLLLSSRSRDVWFIPKSWKKKMTPSGSGWPHLSEPYPIACWFNYWEGDSIYRIGFVIEVGPMKDNAKRIKLVKTFQNKGFKGGTKALREEAKYTRVYSTYVRINDPDNFDLIYKHIEELLEKSQSALKDTTIIIDKFKW